MRNPVTRWRTGLSGPVGGLCVLGALLLLVLAAYRGFAPLHVLGSNGVDFRCGSAVVPKGGDFAASVCGGLVAREQAAAVTLVVAAVLTGLLGPLLVAGRPTSARPAG